MSGIPASRGLHTLLRCPLFVVSLLTVFGFAVWLRYKDYLFGKYFFWLYVSRTLTLCSCYLFIDLVSSLEHSSFHHVRRSVLTCWALVYLFIVWYLTLVSHRQPSKAVIYYVIYYYLNCDCLKLPFHVLCGLCLSELFLSEVNNFYTVYGSSKFQILFLY